MARSREESDETGDGYFASISDLMVGILFIFLLMLTVFAINYAHEDKDKKIDALEKPVAALTTERDALLASSREKDIEIAKLKDEIGLNYLMCAPLSRDTFKLLADEVLPRLP